MNKGRRIAALAAATMAMIGMTSVMAAPASAATKPKGPKPVSALLDTVDSHEGTFVSVWWKTDKKICDFKLRIWSTSKVKVSYPTNTATYTSFYNGSKLKPNQTDYTSFKVTPKFHSDAYAILPATLTFNYCGKHDETISKSTGFLLPVDA